MQAIRVSRVPAIAAALLLGWTAAAHAVSYDVTAITASATAMTLPLSGTPSTGTITIVRNGELKRPNSVLDCVSKSGTISWPVRITFPLLTTLSQPPIDLVSIGTCSTTVDTPDSARIVAFDVGYTERPGLGRVFVCNININIKNKAVPAAGTTIAQLCAGGTLNGVFRTGGYQGTDAALFNARLSTILNTAINNLRDFEPAIPSLRASAVDSIANVYRNDATHPELVAYFLDATTGSPIVVSHLSGTDKLGAQAASVPGSGPWQLGLVGLAMLAIGAWAMGSRRRGIVGLPGA